MNLEPLEQHRRGSEEGGSLSGSSDLNQDSQIGFMEFATILLRRRRIVLGVPALAGLLMLGFTLVASPTYTATTTFLPETRGPSRLPMGLANLAGQFGIPLSLESGLTPQLYADVVKSRELMESVLLTTFRDSIKGELRRDSMTLLHALRVHGRDSADVLQRGTKKLRALVGVRVDNRTNIITLSVESKSASLAAQVANRFVALINDFNTKTRQSQASQRRKFVEGRIVDGERELLAAEDALRRFYENNRSWQQSPQLVFEEGRLRRQVDIRQELYLTLRREYETARIEEVNDTPVITVVDSAVPPKEKSSPKRGMLVLLALVAGAIAGVVAGLSAEYLDRARQAQAKHYEELAHHLVTVRDYLSRRAMRIFGYRGPNR